MGREAIGREAIGRPARIVAERKAAAIAPGRSPPALCHTPRRRRRPTMDTAQEPAVPIPQAPCALVFGASGYIGTNLVPRLLQQGWRVRAAARNPKVLQARCDDPVWRSVDRVAA